MNGTSRSVTLVEVGPRDGFQSIVPLIATADKIAIIEALSNAGLRRIEATSFVSPKALPQMADAEQIVEASREIDELDIQVLVPNARHAERAIAAGARHLAAVLSVSEAHNMGNIRRTPMESVADYAQIVSLLPEGGAMRLNIATAFDCPHEGRVAPEQTLSLLEPIVAIGSDVELALCDTTGKADPAQVRRLFEEAQRRFPNVRQWAFHGHDTYGLGAANALAAWDVGVRTFDAAVAGVGGCPFAPGATGNVATEDLVWMFENMGIKTGVNMPALLAVAARVCDLPGAQIGGRVRAAFGAHACQALEA